MKLLVFIGVFLGSNISWVAASSEASVTVSRPAASAGKLMGIEIETSSVKMHSPGTDMIGFTVTTPFTKTWVIEEDTSDETFKGTLHAEHDRNLEIKTIKGFNEGEIVRVSTDMQELLIFLHTNAISPLEMGAAELSGVLKGQEVRPNSATPPKVSVMAKTEDKVIRPQITYQMPLILLPQVFERLGALGHKKIPVFLDCLNSHIPAELSESEIAKRLVHERLMLRNAGNEKRVRLFLKSTIGPIVAGLDPSNAKGFSFLLLYYWHEIFNNKENPLESLEPGPKKSLAVLSRVPLSQLFDKLNDEDKAIVRGIFEPVMASHGADFKIMTYSNYDGISVSPALTLRDWYQSVVDPSFRREVKGRHVDLLSPPPELDNVGYSMGYLDSEKDASGLLLIEVRGYAKLPLSGKDPEIGDIQTLIGTEAHWFFNILGG